MKLEFAFLADAANMLEHGTFDVIAGGFDVVTGSEFPATKHTIVLITRLRFDPEECGRHYELSGEIVDHEGKSIFSTLRGTFAPPRHPRHSECPNWMSMCLECQGVTFPAPGDYCFRLSVGDKVVGDVTIEAVLEKEPI